MTHWSRRDLLGAGLALGVAGPGWAAATSPPPLPPVVDLSALFGPAKDQGDRMTCMYFAATAAAEAVVARQTGIPIIFSEQYLTDIAHGGGRLPADETTDDNRVMDIVQDFGMVPASARPYLPQQAPGQRVHRPDAALVARGQRVKLEWVSASATGNRIEGLQRRLLRRPMIVALALPHNNAGWRDDGLVEPVPGLVPADDAREKFPNHFVVLTGYDQRQQIFFFRNSWGAGWGRSGYGRISFATMRTRFWEGDALSFLPASA